MNLLLKRIAKKDTYTIGHLYIDGEYFCDTVEDKDRGLTLKMPLASIKAKKVKHETAIPAGTYKLTINVVSPKYSNYSKYAFAKEIGAKLPRLLNVPGFDGILMHPGNTAKDSSGCIIVGENKVVGKVINSTATFKALYAKLKSAKDDVSITIE